MDGEVEAGKEVADAFDYITELEEEEDRRDKEFCGNAAAGVGGGYRNTGLEVVEKRCGQDHLEESVMWGDRNHER